MQDDVVAAVATRIAQRVAPDEIDSAPDIARAAVAGGRAWARLKKQRQGATFGGFGAGEMVQVMFCVLSGLQDTAPHLQPLMMMLASGMTVVASSMTVAVHRLTLNEKKQARLGSQERDPAPAEDQGLAEQRAVEAHRRLTERLVSHGLERPQAEQTAAEVLAELAEHPEDSRAFLASLASR